MLDDLQAQGARVHVGHAAANLGDLGPGDTLVVSSAIRADNPELAEATRRGMRVIHRAAALASVMAGRRVIAVAGTHGKTTTTSMLTTVLRDCGADPGYVIGGILNRDRARRRRRRGPGLRRRGRRERRLVPPALARRGHRHQRGSRPPGQLRQPGRDRGRLRRVRRAASAAWC